MIPEANYIVTESEALYVLITENSDASLCEVSAFKAWSFQDIIRHLHVWNQMAYFSLTDKDAFDAAFRKLVSGMGTEGIYTG
jgi:hypothetical protein